MEQIRASVVLCCLCAVGAFAGLNDGLAGYWTFDEGTGSTAADQSGNGNNGIITNATWVDGVRGGALEFKGKGYVEVPSSPSLAVRDSVTIAAWIWLSKSPDPKVSSGFRSIVNKPGAYHLCVVAYWGLTFRAINDGIITRNVPADSDFTVKRWYHVAVTYSMTHNEQHIYIDGVERPVGNPARVFAVDSNAAALRIGNEDAGPKAGNTNFWEGRIDEVRVYRRPLSAQEVAELYRLDEQVR